jgi:hypothetical protein
MLILLPWSNVSILLFPQQSQSAKEEMGETERKK